MELGLGPQGTNGWYRVASTRPALVRSVLTPQQPNQAPTVAPKLLWVPLPVQQRPQAVLPQVHNRVCAAATRQLSCHGLLVVLVTLKFVQNLDGREADHSFLAQPG